MHRFFRPLVASCVLVVVGASVGCASTPDTTVEQHATNRKAVAKGIYQKLLTGSATEHDIEAVLDALERDEDILAPDDESYDNGEFETALWSYVLSAPAQRTLSVSTAAAPPASAGVQSKCDPKRQNPRAVFRNCADEGTRVNKKVAVGDFEIRISEECGYIGGCVRGEVDHLGFTVYGKDKVVPLVNNHFSVYIPAPAPLLCEDERLLAGFDTLVAEIETCQELKLGSAFKKQRGELLKQVTERFNNYTRTAVKELMKRATTTAIKTGARQAAASFVSVISTFLRAAAGSFFFFLIITDAEGNPIGLERDWRSVPL